MTPDAAALPRDAIDCDVHCAPASMDVLLPYLGDYWRSYIDDATIRLGDLAYPAGAATTGEPAPAAYEDLAPLLDREATRSAVLSCVVLDGVHRNPHYAAAVATAVNDWLRDAWLDARRRACGRASSSRPSTSRRPCRRSSASRTTRASCRSCSRCAPTCPTATALYHPLYAAAERNGLRVALHAWGARGRRAEHDRHRTDATSRTTSRTSTSPRSSC